MPKEVTDVICPFCGTLCDDIRVTVSDDNKTILGVKNACAIGAEKFNHQRLPGRVKRPRMRQADGTFKEITYDEAIDWTGKNARKVKKDSHVRLGIHQLPSYEHRPRDRRKGWRHRR